MKDGFTGLLNDYIDKVGVTNNNLIRMTGIDRSTFYKILSGKRQPTEEQFKAIICALSLPRLEEEALRREYVRETLGEEEWQNRQTIRKLLHVLAEPELEVLCPVETSRPASVDFQNYTAQGPDPANQMMLRFLQDEFGKEYPRLSFFMPVDREQFYSVLRDQCTLHAGKQIQIRQLMQFPTGSTFSKCSILEYFEHLVYHLTRGPWDYQAYFYYERALLPTGLGNLFPYYIIAGGKILMLNADFTRSMLLREPEIVSMYETAFEEALAASKPIRETIGYAEMLMALEMPGKKISFESIPCAAMVAKSDYTRKYIADGAFGDFIWNHCKRLQEENELLVFSTMGGLERFAQTGQVEEVPSALMAPMSVEDRIESFENLKAHIQKEYFIVDETVLPVSSNWMLTLYEDNTLYIYPRIATGDEQVICVQEKNIINAFTSFFRSLSKGPDVLGKEKVLMKINEMIETLSNDAFEKEEKEDA